MTTELHISTVPEAVRDAALSVGGDADAVAWGELVGLRLSGRALVADSGVDFVYLIERLATEDLVEFRYLLREHFGKERRDPDEEESLYTVAAHLVEVLEHEIAGRWVGLGKK